MKEQQHFDVIVIGSGPGGEGAALKLAKAGQAVAVIEKHISVGGGCTHWGTIPSKALIHLARTLPAQNAHHSGSQKTQININFKELMQTVENVVASQVQSREGFYRRNNITVIEGFARFIDSHQLEVSNESGLTGKYSADCFVIATGSHPYHPEDIPFDRSRVLDSDTILLLETLPASMTVYGAGVIGSEYASVFRNLGVKVNLVNTRGRLLEYLDEEISTALSYHLRDELGLMIRQNEEYDSVEVKDDAVVLKLKTGKVIKSDILLWANGRTGNSSAMGLEELGITIDHRGNIQTNAAYQSSQPHIYAVGDIVGFPSLASAAYDQGHLAAAHILKEANPASLSGDIPTGIYTTPEIGCIGKTEQELTDAKVPYEVGRSFFRNLARGQISGCRYGMLKLLFQRETLALLGVHCFGRDAAEIIHIGQAVMSQPAPHNTIEYFLNTTFNYPTMAEAYRVAALNGANRL